MKHSLSAMLAALGCMLVPVIGNGQVETRPTDVLRAEQQLLPGLAKDAQGTLSAHLKRMQAKGKSLKAASNAARVAQDVKGMKVGDFVYYSVPAMSENQYLPDVYPVDGIAMKRGQIIMAADEYEPCSFLIYPLKDMGKVQLSLTEFKTKDGKVFPASALNLKTVKVWYQNHNAWTSYFGDTELRLVPELLMNDEDLIKVDTQRVQNYARLTEADGRVHYQWITPPKDMDTRVDDHYRANSTFLPMKGNFRDAKTLQPVLLSEGAFKQFFLTAHAAKNQPAGVYKGAVKLTDANGKAVGEIPVQIRVLPFVLPSPKTYFDVKKDYLSGSYSYLSIPLITLENGGDEALAWKQLEAILRNQAEHGQTLHWMRDTTGPKDWEFIGLLETFKKAGMSTNPIIGIHPEGDPSEWKMDAKLKREWMLKNLGHTNAIMLYGDEPGAEWVMNQRPVYKVYQEAGFKFIIAGQENVLFKAGYVYDFFNFACDPAFSREKTRRWNEIGHANVAWYAGQHVGPENPAFNRRQYGLGAYLANFSANFNYAHHLGPYNDRSAGYRPMVFAYGVYDGVLDTLQWEGFREGIDDIRYATLLKTLALEASESKDIDTVYAGRQALQYLALCQPDTVDLNTARYEMIDRILQLKKMLNK